MSLPIGPGLKIAPESRLTKSDANTDTNDIGYYPEWPFNFAAKTFRDVSANWRLLHNAFDLELGRAYYITKALSLRPHWGLRGGWINQKFKSCFSTETTHVDRYTKCDFHAKNNYWGIGPRVGIHANGISLTAVGASWEKLLLLCFLGKRTMHYYVEDVPVGAEL